MNIIQQTQHEVIVFKPAGMACELSHDTRKHSLLSKLQEQFKAANPKLPHRLDRITCGIVLVALTDEAIAFYGDHIRHGDWQKYYLARIVISQKQQKSIHQLPGQYKAFLKKEKNTAKIVRSGGKPSLMNILSVHPAPQKKQQFHVLIQLLTGRYHQIRVMMSHLGFPLAHDPVYATAPEKKTNRYINRHFYLEHILLKYTNYTSREPETIFLEKRPGRERLHPQMEHDIRQIATS